MRLATLVSLLLLAVAGLLAPVGPAWAHARHETHADARTEAPAVTTVPILAAVLEAGSHCPGDSGGGCCCGTDRCAGTQPSRWLAAPPGATLPTAAPGAPLHVRWRCFDAPLTCGAPATTRLARAPPRVG